MPNKSKKSNSKRSTLKHKYKVIKKVKQHLKKKAKEEKKARKAGKKPKALKDPGIPSQWPFKEELMKDLEWQKQRIIAQEKAKKDMKRQKRAAEQDPEVDDEEMVDPISLSDVAEHAGKKQSEYNAKKRAKLEQPIFANDKDGTKRAFYKEFVKVVTASDVIIEVLDARDPIGSRSLDAEKFIRRAGSDKKIILLLNKIDLVPRENVEAWLKYLREEMPAIAFKCSTQKQASNLKQRRGKGAKIQKPIPVTAATQTSDSLGAETVLQLLKNYSRNLDIKTAITVGIIGYPNVGKSSLINSLKRARVANVGNAPGITRTIQQVSLDKHINLIDSPGMVFSAPEAGNHWAALRNCIRVEQLEDPRSAVEEVVKRCPAKQLMALYKVPAFKDSEDFLQAVAFQRGRLLPGGVGDSSSAARVVLHDWHNGKIPYYTTPPKRGSGEHEDAAILSSWGQEFNVDKVFANEKNAVIAGLKSMDDTKDGQYFATETSGRGQSMLEDIQDGAQNPLPDVADANMGSVDSSESDSDDSEAEDSDDEVTEEVPGLAITKPSSKASTKPKKLPSQPQTEILYSESGQFNPAMARAEKKRQKKAKKLSLGDDFNFVEAFADEVNLAEDEAEADAEEDDSEEDGSEIDIEVGGEDSSDSD